MRHVLGIVPAVMISHTTLHISFGLIQLFYCRRSLPKIGSTLKFHSKAFSTICFSAAIVRISLISFFLWALPYVVLLVKLYEVQLPHLLESQILTLYFPQSSDEKLDQVPRQAASLKPLEAHLKSHDNFVTIEQILDLVAAFQTSLFYQLAAGYHLEGKFSQAPDIEQHILLLVDEVRPLQFADILSNLTFTSELTMLFWLMFPYEKCIELRQVIAVSTQQTLDPISCQFKGYFLSDINSAIVSPAKNSSMRQRYSVSQKIPKHLTIKLWLISTFLMQNFISSQSYFYLANAAFLYPFITNTAWVFLLRATIQRYYSYSLMVLRILKSSIVGVFWLFLFFKKDGAILHFFSQGLAGFFACFLSKKLLSFGVLGALAISLLLFKGARYLRAKGRGLNVVRKLWTDK